MSQTKLGGYLVTLGQHLLLNPDLPAIAGVRECFWFVDDYRDGLDIQLTKSDASALVEWARTLLGVSSEVQRLRGGEVHGHLYGRIGDVPVCVWTTFPGESPFPRAYGTHEWDVTAQLQEA